MDCKEDISHHHNNDNLVSILMVEFVYIHHQQPEYLGRLKRMRSIVMLMIHSNDSIMNYKLLRKPLHYFCIDYKHKYMWIVHWHQLHFFHKLRRDWMEHYW